MKTVGSRQSLLIWSALIASLFIAVPKVSGLTTQSAPGVSISPTRSEIIVGEGKNQKTSITVSNISDQPIEVTMEVEKFSITDSKYDYYILPSSQEYITLSDTSFTLSSHGSKTVTATVQPPLGSAPGSSYDAIIASITQKSSSVTTTVRAASLVYLTVGGNIKKSGSVSTVSINPLQFGQTIPYSLDVIDTGNTYFKANSGATLSNLWSTTKTNQGISYIIPDKPRHIIGQLPSPFWPGIYTASIGYMSNDGGGSNSKKVLVAYLPPWAIIFSLLIVYLVARTIITHRRRRSNSTSRSYSDKP